MKLGEVLQALSVISGIVATIVGMVVARVRSNASKELRQIDVSAEWQNQMLARISAVESELQRERVRGDALEREAYEWRKTANDLEWELKLAKRQREEMLARVDKHERENAQLRKQNAALAKELRELHRQISGGHQSMTIPPLRKPSKED